MNVEISRPLDGQWSEERARAWGLSHSWLCGFNFLPSSAVNFLEMWRGDSFDAASIDRELGWAAAIGFNALRTNLHYLDWRHDPEGLIARVAQFLEIAAAHGLASMICLFDDCEFSGEPPHWGAQQGPRPGIHNGRAIGSPGRRLVGDRDLWPSLRDYVQGVIHAFAEDPRVAVWDLYNEPGNRMILEDGRQREHDHLLENDSDALMRASFAWAREVGPTQPLTVGAWRLGTPGAPAYAHRTDLAALALSDVVSFHAYCPLDRLRGVVADLQGHGRPMFCTEWMARGLDSRIRDQLPYLRSQGVGAFQWGLVRGRTQTHLPWPGVGIEMALRDGGEPEWFHDILSEDGQPHCHDEVHTIRAARGLIASAIAPATAESDVPAYRAQA
ncbi:MAG: 1,4-beta-xylanase [Rhodobacteraceae bacterium]|nr:1,4-beta-xylanase [Paracoccaceae bacterium]